MFALSDPAVYELVLQQLRDSAAPFRQLPSEHTASASAASTSASTSTASFASSASDSASTSKSSSQSAHIWKENEIQCLLHLRIPMDQDFLDGKKKHDILWAEIHKKMQESKFTITATQIANKWNQLKRRYKEVKDNNRLTGRERKDFKYESQFDELYGEKASTNPIFLLDSFQTKKINDNNGNNDEENDEAPDEARDDVNASCDTPKERGKKRKRKRERESPKMTDMIGDMLQMSKDLHAGLSRSHDEKMTRFDRFLNLYEQSVTKKTND